ncbi:23S rRNA pseudouridine(2604) synthase [Seminavis robusta]|uniref:23S rRNA pseudouridine(2604) synthase n=1 Tax=Seminavis robusta TaxID=568900 RepID=A0A9N8ETN1_9STRA|nr:23S rRNA pseudouridine(2604) synthase [Seminavis robusta]|eukprot:Sro1841_g301010.1 23S rRNA pseudouridine(2604) synthase (377) ;mRNA; r:16501-17631
MRRPPRKHTSTRTPSVHLLQLYSACLLLASVLEFAPTFCLAFISTTSARTTVGHSRSSLLPSHAHSSSNNNNNSNDNSIRLNKVFKATHSRREADALIDSGRIAVNGQPVHQKGGFKVKPFIDKVSLDGVVIKGWEAMNGLTKTNHATSRRNDNKKSGKNSVSTTSTTSTTKTFEYIKYWKPRGITCTTDRSIPTNIIDDLIQRRGCHPQHRIYPVGRLDKDTSGLILLTSDGRLPNSALRGKFKQPKVYQVLVDRPIQPNDLQQLRTGVVITTVAQRDGNRGKPLTAPTLPCRVDRIPQTKRRGVVMTLVEGRNRQIRKMMAALGYSVVQLHRVQFMGITLQPLKQEGTWKTLDHKEMTLVRNVLDQAATAVDAQ